MSGRMLTRRGLALALTLLTTLTTACAGVAAPTATPEPSRAWLERGPITLAVDHDWSGTWPDLVRRWNSEHPAEPVTIAEIPAGSEQRAVLADRGAQRVGEYTVMVLDVSWIAEFAASGWLSELPAAQFPTTGLLADSLASATFSSRLYAYPQTSDVGLLYYRKDLLDKARLSPPRTWSELAAACRKVFETVRGVDCYTGQFDQGEGLTSNVVESINSAEGEFTTPYGVPAVDSPNAISGLQWLVDGFETGRIPEDALSWRDWDARKEFLAGNLLFFRDWAGLLAQAKARGIELAGEVDVAPLPGRTGPGVPVLGGRSLAISAFGGNLGTAAEFTKWATSTDVQLEFLRRSGLPPVTESLFTQTSPAGKVGELKVLATSVSAARPLPRTKRYPEVSEATQLAGLAALKGEQSASAALTGLQARLVELLE